VLCLAQPTASAQTTNKIISVADTYIIESFYLGGPDSTHGEDPTLEEIGAGGYQSFPLVRFDLSQYAGHTVVGPASLTLNVPVTWSNVTVSQTINVYRILIPWNEATVSWNIFGPGPICSKCFVYVIGHCIRDC
jgi:hypothetical protein